MILVVDDDPEILDHDQRFLSADKRVLFASTAGQALRMQHLGLSVVLVNVRLPDASRLLEKLHESNPRLLFIGMTNRTYAHGIGKHQLGLAEVLEKPVTPEWSRVVERVLSRPRN